MYCNYSTFMQIAEMRIIRLVCMFELDGKARGSGHLIEERNKEARRRQN